jgi:AbrB family looped-hinge helix DNA binding protein
VTIDVGGVSTKGRVTVPKEIREAFHSRAGDELIFDIEGGDRAVVGKANPERLTAVLDRLGPLKGTGVDRQRKFGRDWNRRDRRH